MPSDVFRNTFCRDPSPQSSALWLFFAFGKLIPALACRPWSHHLSSSLGFACPSSHTERAENKRQHLSWSCNSAWRSLWGRRLSESCWGHCPGVPSPHRRAVGATILPLLPLQPSVPTSAPLQVVTPFPWGSWCCGAGQGQGIALLHCSEPAAPQKCSLGAALARWIGQSCCLPAPLVRHFL